ncbi:hypothetical protein ES288_D13G137200v1 [Gossypium darwinii]|uniref:Uncharacterized protein n=1 Tax=Gossypium darwinii TaxID=34276 RepID=A0A5D1ZXP1_GOSDA|nr:hypothetical protein ES288_D13G137200v1 [Gossypium darwinii]
MSKFQTFILCSVRFSRPKSTTQSTICVHHYHVIILVKPRPISSSKSPFPFCFSWKVHYINLLSVENSFLSVFLCHCTS